jgi:hypothetical protein
MPTNIEDWLKLLDYEPEVVTRAPIRATKPKACAA